MIDMIRSAAAFVAGSEMPKKMLIAQEATLDHASQSEVALSVRHAQRQWITRFVTVAGLRESIIDTADTVYTQARHNPGTEEIEHNEQGEQ